MAKIDEVLDRHWKELKALHPGILNVGVSEKWQNNLKTGVPSITIYVAKKLPKATLSPESIIPDMIEDIPTDVIEFNPKRWEIGKTEISETHPADQRHKMGLIPMPSAPFLKVPMLQTPKGMSEWSAWAYEVQDQGNCGACSAFGNTGVWETLIRIAAKNPQFACKLSEAHLFFCTPGVTCETGSTVAAILNQAMKGVCLESCLPYKDVDQACAAGICPNWLETAYKLLSWNAITDPNAQKVLLDQGPLNCTMEVHQSFFNYVSGIYQNLGPQDPIVGYHDMGNLGYNDGLGADLIRNSWGPTWGPKCVVNGIIRPGYCWIAYGQLDAERQQLILGSFPPPPAPPAPPKKKCSIFSTLKLKRENKGGK